MHHTNANVMLKFDFEIKVALLGHVSVGKTTILNALFREKFSEVSMKRTTAGINHFRVTTKRKVDGRKSNDEEFINVDGDDESTDSSSNHMSAKATLAEIMADNANLRNSNHIEEKFFDIELDHPIISNMRDDTCMVIVDIPGVNEAGTQKMYLDYVEKAWDTFDIIIVVMDAQQGVNTDEQVSLLNFVNNNNDFRKDIPVIVLCNKVDDPEDKELAALVEEAQREVERIFSVGDRKKALSALLENKLDQDSLEEGTPAFLHISAENAFLYRATSRLGVKGLKKLNKSYIDKIGRQEVGKFKWKKLSENEQYELVHDILSDPDLYEERLESSNFDKLLYLLDLFVGGKDQQEKIIDKQLEVSLRKLSVENGIVDQLHNIFVRSHALGRDTLPIEDRFWELWEKQCENALKEFDKSPSNLSSLQVPMKELISFERCLHKKLHNVPRNGTKITTAMQGLVEKHINIILQKANQWDPNLIEEELDEIGQFKPYGKSFRSGSDPHFGNAAKASTNPFGKAPMTSDSPFGASAKRDNSTPPFSFGTSNSATSPFGSASGTGSVHFSFGTPPFGTSSKRPQGPSQENSTDDGIRVVGTSKQEDNTSDEKFVRTQSMNQEKLLALESWEKMSPKDWVTIFSSILLLTHRKVFAERFGQEVADMEWTLHTAKFTKPDDSCKESLDVFRRFMRGSYKHGVFVPLNQDAYDRAVQIKVPNSMSDPCHRGHLAWLFCEFMDSRSTKAT